MPHALIVEDDHNSLTALEELVQGEGFTTATAKTLADARTHVGDRVPTVLLVDLVLPDGSGIDLLKEVGPNGAQVVLITGHASVDTAVEALRMGACDYLTKPLDVSRLRTVLANIARTNELREENAKGRYVSAPLDDRSAWALFDDPAAVRAEVTATLYAPDGEDAALRFVIEGRGHGRLRVVFADASGRREERSYPFRL